MSFIFLHLEHISCCCCKQLAHILKTPVSDSAQAQTNRYWMLSRTFQFLSHSLTLGSSCTGNLCPRKLAHTESSLWTVQLWVICMREGMKSLSLTHAAFALQPPWNATLQMWYVSLIWKRCNINLLYSLNLIEMVIFSGFSPQLNNMLILFFLLKLISS